MGGFQINGSDRRRLRLLAKKQREYSQLPLMKARREAWFRHNDLKSDTPMICFDIRDCADEMLPALQCESAQARNIESQLYRNMLNHEKIGDDRVVPANFKVDWDARFLLFGLYIKEERAQDRQGRKVGRRFKHPIKDLEKEINALGPSIFKVDRKKTKLRKMFAEAILGDILPVEIAPPLLSFRPSKAIVSLMGMEAMLYSIMDSPDLFRKLLRMVAEEQIGYMQWMEREKMLFLNTDNSDVKQGTFGFTEDLPGNSSSAIKTENLWGFMESQETLCISPEMYGEFFFNFYSAAAEKFGLLSYGCCEPVHPLWEQYLSKMPNLRKISISPWCDEGFMGKALKGSGVIYHRKPDSNYIGGPAKFNEDAFRAHILKTISCAKGCKLEITFRNVYTLNGDIEKPARAVRVARELIADNWK